MKTSELIDEKLDWAVAKCEGIALVIAPFTGAKNFVILGQNMKPTSSTYEPSKYWAQGGPIIERERIAVKCSSDATVWIASQYWACADTPKISEGPTPLIAAMRCYVASKLGDEIEIPKDLT